MLINKHKKDINNKNLVRAIKNTFNKRNTELNIDKFKETVKMLKESNTIKNVFINYQKKLENTKNVSFNDTIDTIAKIIGILDSELN
jgi:hypothetical protein